MANDNYAGFNPEDKKAPEMVAQLDRTNPYEFRKGMDYELTNLGCLRLQESTPEERKKATKTVLNNLEEYSSYYSSLIHYETTFRNIDKKPAWKTWLKEFHEETSMKEVGQTYKNDKMTEPKIKSQEISTKADIKQKALKEAIKKEIKKALLKEQDDDLAFDDGDEKEVKKKADQAGAKIQKGMSRFDDEKKAIDELLFGEVKTLSDKEIEKGQKEISAENPAEGSLLYRKNENLETYKQNKDVAAYKDLIKLNDNEIKTLEDHIEKFGAGKDGKGLGNDVTLDNIKGKDLPDTIKKLQERKKAIDKEIQGEVEKMREQRREIAETDLTRDDQLMLLEICKSNGVNLREGSDTIKHYYEIAKTSFLEGLAKGSNL